MLSMVTYDAQVISFMLTASLPTYILKLIANQQAASVVLERYRAISFCVG